MPPEGVAIACSSRCGRLIDGSTCSQDAWPFVRSLQAVAQVPWATHVGLLLRLSARPSVAPVVRAPELPAAWTLPMVQVAQLKGLKRRLRDRQLHERLSTTLAPLDAVEETVVCSLLSETFVQDKTVKCLAACWTEHQKETAALPVHSPPAWVRRSLAFQRDPGRQ